MRVLLNLIGGKEKHGSVYEDFDIFFIHTGAAELGCETGELRLRGPTKNARENQRAIRIRELVIEVEKSTIRPDTEALYSPPRAIAITGREAVKRPANRRRFLP